MEFGWSTASILQAMTTNFAGMVALRCLIGVFEAGFAPGVALFLSFFYRRSEMGFRYGLFVSFAPIANCVASALAYGIVHVKTSLAEWQLLFKIGRCSWSFDQSRAAFLILIGCHPIQRESLLL